MTFLKNLYWKIVYCCCVEIDDLGTLEDLLYSDLDEEIYMLSKYDSISEDPIR
jgi:hypothetical protein